MQSASTRAVLGQHVSQLDKAADWPVHLNRIDAQVGEAFVQAAALSKSHEYKDTASLL